MNIEEATKYWAKVREERTAEVNKRKKVRYEGSPVVITQLKKEMEPIDNIIQEVENEKVVIKEILYELNEMNRLPSGAYRIPAHDLIPTKHWGTDVSSKTFTISGEEIKSIT